MKDAMKEALGHLHRAKEEIQALSGPLRENRDTLVRAGLDDQTYALDSRIREIESGLAGIENAIGILSVALGGKVLKVEPASTEVTFHG